MANTTRRQYQRFPVKIPILVNGVDNAGQVFQMGGEILNRSVDGLGLLLAEDPSPLGSLLVCIADGEQLIQIQTEIRHVTNLDSTQRLVGVRFRGIHNPPSSSVQL